MRFFSKSSCFVFISASIHPESMLRHLLPHLLLQYQFDLRHPNFSRNLLGRFLGAKIHHKDSHDPEPPGSAERNGQAEQERQATAWAPR